jgi:ankyrin repeat protein
MSGRVRKPRPRKKRGVGVKPKKPKNATLEKVVVMSGDALLSSLIHADDGVTPLMAAAQKGDLVRFHRLLQDGADINQRDDRGKTVLMHALENKDANSELLALCISLSANPDLVCDNEGFDAFDYAYTANNPAAIGMIFGTSDHFKEYIRNKQNILLHAFTNNFAMALFFTNFGAEVHLADINGNTLMHYLITAVFVYHRSFNPLVYNLVSAMLEEGASLDAPNNDGLTPCDILKDVTGVTDFLLLRLKSCILLKKKEYEFKTPAQIERRSRERIQVVLDYAHGLA